MSEVKNSGNYRFVWRMHLSDSSLRDGFIENWRVGSSILQQYPGAKGTRLYEIMDEENSYLAIAEWVSKEARDEMQADIDAGQSPRAKHWQKLPKSEAFGEVTIIARAKEIDAVLPEI